MKKLLVVLLILSGYLSFGQVTPVKSVKVASSTTLFNENIPKGTIIIEISSGKEYLTLLPLVSSKTIATCIIGTDIKQIDNQIISLTPSTGVSITGTYPNFTIANTNIGGGGTVTSVTGTSPLLSSGGTTPDISMPVAASGVSGYLSASDWSIFNAKGDMTLAGVQSVSGTKTFDKDKIALKGTSTGVTTLSTANTSATPYTITLPAATGTVALTSDISNGTTTNFTGSLVGDVSGTQGATVVGKINGTSLSALTTGILKNTTGTGVPTIAVAGTDYLTPSGSAASLTGFPTLNQNTTGNAATVTTNANLTGEVTSIGNTATLSNAAVIGKALTGYVSGAGTVSATDNILQAIQKLNGNDATNASSVWKLTGNAGTTPGTNFIGTSDNQDVVFKRNGVQAGLLNNSLFNTSWGMSALSPATSGTNNVAIGYSSLATNTTGTFNTATGFSTLSANSTGSSNTATGSNALGQNSTGSSNTATGYYALRSNDTGVQNTALGYNAGYGDGTTLAQQSTIDNYATFLGYRASRDIVANTTPLSNITAIGYMAKVSQNNSLILGGTGANAVSVGIGNTAPAASSVLDITSTTKGSLMPRMTTAQKTAIATPATGLIVYDTDLNQLQVYNGTSWGVSTANLTGDVTSLGTATTIANNAVTIGKMQQIATNSLLGRSTATTGNPEVITVGSGLTLSGGTLTAAGSGGTVTTASVVTANGVSGSVANPTTAPAITLTLGAITPTSVAATGALSGSSLSTSGSIISTVATGTAPLLVTSTTPVANLSIGGNAATATTVVTNANLTGEVTSVGNTTTVTNAAVTGKALTGYVSGAGVISATDNILQAIQKLNGNDVTNSNSVWNLTGNSGTTAGTNFIGTSDDKDVVFKRFGIQSGLLNNALQNTSWGVGALKPGSGTGNVATGTSALNKNTSGSNNVATGYQALFSNTFGHDNIATGYNALNANTSGNYNIAIGSAALSLNTNGNYNVATGYNSLSSNTTGLNNTATGYNALNANTVGKYNIAIGSSALNLNTSGDYNIATGGNALNSNTTGQLNIAVGYNAGYGDGASLQPSITDNNATFLGSMASRDIVANTTSLSNITAIGYMAKVSQNNSLILGGTGANAVSVGIGNTAPAASAVLDITSTTQGSLLPRMTTVQKTAIATPATGLIVYDNTLNQLQVYNGTAWGGTAATGWGLTGNVGTTAGTNFIGTSDDIDVVFKRNGIQSGLLNKALLNTSWGISALSPATTGSNNVATGYNALNANTTGSSNIATGSNALKTNTTGSNNVATGYWALNANTSGGSNVATGTYALSSNTTGTNNVASGFWALYGNSTGYNNNATGIFALKSNTTGFNNDATGSEALQFNTTGSSNVATGHFSLNTNTTGSNNTALGFQAGYGDGVTAAQQSITDNNATFLGNQASRDIIANTTSLSNITAIGYMAKVSQSNSMILGGTAASGNAVSVGIGNTAPAASAVLDITSTTQGSLMPRMTTVQKTAIATPATGLIVFDTDLAQLQVYNGTSWGATVASSGWGLTGNTGTTAGTNYIGTLDDKDVIFKRNGVQSGLLNNALQNTSWGVGALNPATTGTLNIANGYNALSINTTGTGNIATGYSALLNNTTGNYNVVTGINALKNNTSGSSNVATGTSALAANTTGNNNVAIGYSALNGNTIGQNNIATGSQSLNLNTSGNSNIATGNFALSGNTTGSNNVAIGFQAFNLNTTGTQNTALGNWAGYGDGLTLQASLTDNNATFVGTQASRDIVANTTTLTNITAIGYNAKVSQSNSLILGNNAVSVGIGNTAPAASAVLDITSITKGALLPRMTTVQKAAIATPAAGLLVYDNTLNQLQVYNGTAWGGTAGASGWGLTGNVGTSAATNFLGTSDDIDVVFKRNNVQSGLLNNALFNTSWGVSALNPATTGNKNVATGYNALQSNTTGNNNVATGYGALMGNTTGNFNVAVGTNTFSANTTGTSNSAIGAQALQSNTTGGNNTALGVNSGYGSGAAVQQSISDVYATFLGYQASRDIVANTTSLFNITAIGSNAKVSQNNSLILGGTGTYKVSVGIGNTAPDLSAVLDITSTTQGTLLPRMTTSQKAAISTPAAGLLVYDNTLNQLQVYNGTAWGATASGWGLTGNAGTTAGTNFLGTSDNIDVVIKRNSIQSGFLNTYNTSWGVRALNPASTGSYNTAIGDYPLWQNTTGHDNVAIGSAAIYSNLGGINNVAIGSYAGYSNTSGNFNTAVGFNALNSSNTNNDNTAIGNIALKLNNGYYNTAVGSGAGMGDGTTLQTSTQDTKATFVGYQASRDLVTNSSTLSNITAIGYMAKVSQNNSLVLGGTGANAVNVGIGTSAPDYKAILDLTSTTQGLLIPRLTTAQKNALYGPAGLIIYDLGLNQMQVYNGSAWGSAVPTSSWGLTGNAGTTAGTNYIGTSDDIDVVFKRQGTQSGLLNSALSNTSWGVGALKPTTTGSYNVATGYRALLQNTTGSNNVATGSSSLYFNTTGHDNIATGTSALQANTFGNYNIATGYNALFRNTTGINNIATGAQALTNNTTGQDNIATGYNALYFTNTGISNIATGSYALYQNTTGTNNIAEGYNALYNNSTGGNNTALGYQAGYGDGTTSAQKSITDNNATFLGYQASRDIVANTTPLSNITAIGYMAKVSQNNSLILGGTGANAVSVGIGNTAPAASAILDITSTTQGTLLPRMTTVQKAAIATPAAGLLVYDNTLNQLQVYNGTAWGGTAGASGWGLTGNAGTTAGTNFIGTSDDKDVIFKRNGVQSGLLNNALQNTSWGVGALNPATSGYGNNVAIGAQALQVNTTGAQNVATGGSSLIANTTGHDNIATGYEALYSNTTGHDNIASGTQALYYNLAASYNVAIGTSALASNTTGHDNVATGYQTLNANTTGRNNIATGSYALSMNTLGISNIAIGYAALGTNSTAGFNVAIGTNALATNSTGASNTAIGNMSLNLNDTGGSNVAIGANAGLGDGTTNQGSVLDNNATFLGFQASRDLVAPTTALTNITAIGYKAKVSQSNSLILGGTSVNGTAVSVGIGITAPDVSAVLDITSTTKGSLMPRMTTAQKTAIATPAAGLIVYDNTLNQLQVYNGTAWGGTAGASGWGLTGNAGTTPGTNFIGTSDDQDVVFKRNGVQSGLLNHALFNTAFGESALNPATSGASNVAIGNGTLPVNTLGSDNTAIGSQALYANTTGSMNIAIGTASLWYNTTGGTNVAIGKMSLSTNMTGNNNVAIGQNTLGSIISGINNTAIGVGAGLGDARISNQHSTIDNNALFLGYQASRDIVANTTSLSNITAIGYMAKVSQNNSLILGGTGANAVSVGIGNTAPDLSAVLDITSTTQGALLPRMTTVQKAAITSPAAGLIVYDNTLNELQMYNGTAWGTVVREAADEFTATAAQTAFTLTQTPSPNSKVKMYINGIRISNTAYSTTGTALTYVPANNGTYVLVVGDRIQMDYSY